MVFRSLLNISSVISLYSSNGSLTSFKSSVCNSDTCLILEWTFDWKNASSFWITFCLAVLLSLSGRLIFEKIFLAFSINSSSEISKLGFLKLKSEVPMFYCSDLSLADRLLSHRDKCFFTKGDHDWDQFYPVREL